jgi:hypothetical protein
VIPFLGVSGGQIPDAGIGAADVASEDDVGNQAMDVHRPPGRIPGRRPRALDVRSFPNDDRTGLECRPGVRHDHDEKGEEVQQEPEKNVEGLFPSILHSVPAIPIEIERSRLEQEEDAVKDEGGEKDISQIVHEFGIEAN